tara:strand:- start:1736 stop:2017 length:282 start_codon:yes stop_codon:yes gene_type:complete
MIRNCGCSPISVHVNNSANPNDPVHRKLGVFSSGINMPAHGYKFQDRKYGVGNRVHNKAKQDGDTVWRCSICLNTYKSPVKQEKKEDVVAKSN